MSTEGPLILVAGAVNTDLVATMERAPHAGETITGTSFANYGGGKGANQAVAASRAGGRVALLGALGSDAFGEARRQDLENDNIDTQHVRVDANLPSGVALILVERGGENRIAYVPGATLGVGVDVAIEALGDPSLGLVLATNELPHNTLRALFTGARNRGVPVVFNATPDPETCIDLLPHVSVLIANAGEAQVITGQDRHASPGVLASTLRSIASVDTVLLTAGKEGAFLATEDGLSHANAPVVDVVDTTGAGDTFCGAFASEYVRSRNVADAVLFAVAASAISVTRAGAQPSIPDRREIESFLTSNT